jgi:hypothetical protein
MNDEQHDEQVEPDEQAAADEQQAPSGDAQSTPEANVDRSGPTSEDESEAITDLDDAGDVTPADAVAESLREALGSMREEADRIATLGTGEEQVAASEQFAEDAGKLDEQVGAAARAADAADD